MKIYKVSFKIKESNSMSFREDLVLALSEDSLRESYKDVEDLVIKESEHQILVINSRSSIYCDMIQPRVSESNP